MLNLSLPPLSHYLKRMVYNKQTIIIIIWSGIYRLQGQGSRVWQCDSIDTYATDYTKDKLIIEPFKTAYTPVLYYLAYKYAALSLQLYKYMI